MRKTLYVITTVLLITLLCLTIASAQMRNNGWINFASGQHRPVGVAGQDHIFVKLDTAEELQQMANQRAKTSELALTNGRHPSLPQVAIRGLDQINTPFELSSTPAKVTYQVARAKDGKSEHQLFLRQIKRNGKNLLVSEPNSGSRPLKASPNGKKYLFVDENLFTVDADTLETRQLTKDQVGQFNRPEMVNQMLAGKESSRGLHWVHNPHFNPAASLISYETNRDVADGLSIWTIDPATGEERQLVSAPQGLSTIGWVDNQRIAYLQRLENKLAVQVTNATTGDTTTAITNVRPLAINGTTLIYRQDLNIYSLNLETQESTLLAQPQEKQFFDDFAAFSPNGANVVLRSRIQPNDQTIVIINLASLTVQEVAGPRGQMISSNPSWIDDNRLMVDTFNWPPANGMEYTTWIYQL